MSAFAERKHVRPRSERQLNAEVILESSCKPPFESSAPSQGEIREVSRLSESARPIALHARDPRRGERVVYCSCAAGRLGIHPGMSLAEAASLADASRLYLETHDPDADRQALEQLAVWCERFSPVVGLEAVEQPHCLLLDVTGIGSLFGGEERLVSDVIQSFDQRGYKTQLAIADTLGAAWALARYGSLPRKTVTSLHESFTDDAQSAPAGVEDVPVADLLASFIIIPSGKTRQAICGLPIEALRLSPQHVQTLRQLGVCTIGQLDALPRDGLNARFDESLLRRWDQATGKISEVIDAFRSPVPLRTQWDLEHPTTRREAIEQILEHLAEQLVQLLVQQGQGAILLRCRLDCVATKPLCIEISLFRPTARASHLHELVQTQLEQRSLLGPVQRVTLQAVITARLTNHQRSLLDQQPFGQSWQLAQLVDRLSSRLGRDQVLSPRMVADRQVERAYRYVPLTGQKRKTEGRRTKDEGERGERRLAGRELVADQRPLCLYDPPLALEVIAIAPYGPPVRFVYEEHQLTVARHWGPERIETGWWRGPSVRREYYRVEDQHGSRFWVFRGLKEGRWFLQGKFE